MSGLPFQIESGEEAGVRHIEFHPAPPSKSEKQPKSSAVPASPLCGDEKYTGFAGSTSVPSGARSSSIAL